MSIRRSLIDFLEKAISRAWGIGEERNRDRYNLDIVLSWALQKATCDKELFFPADYVELLRDCIEAKRLILQEIKTCSDAISDSSVIRFSTLVDVLRKVPAIEFSIAQEIALLADSFRAHRTSIETKRWIGDVGTHFLISSSFGTKGRILNTIVRFTCRKQCLELGTGYGMSALFMLEALKTLGEDTHLTTLEGTELQFSISSKLLSTRYGDRVSCKFGWTQDSLPRIVGASDYFDFLFHDAGHSRDDYVRDFQTVLPILSPGAIVIFDDIRWKDSRFYQEDPHCYEGWMEVVNHPRVCRAIEINGNMGLLLLHTK